jgi:PhnB protein
MGARKDFHTVTPYMVFKRAADAIEFCKKAFGAEETMRFADKDGSIRHAEIRIGDSSLMLVDEFSEFPEIRSVQTLGGSPVQIFLYVDDADAVFKRAVEAGADGFHPPRDAEYGRAAGVKDPFGLVWWITAHKEFSPPA